MTLPVFTLMQQAVDIVGDSAHPSNKIAAALSGQTAAGEDFAIARNNAWPPAIRQRIGMDTRIGNASGTVHAETACLLHAPRTEGGALFVTDLPCPNCVKNMAEAGIKTLYIDHKGFAKDYALRHGGDFTHMSMRICEKAGISVYKIFRKEERIEPILEVPPGYRPQLEKPPHVETLDAPFTQTLFLDWIDREKERYAGGVYALGLARNSHGQAVLISAQPHPAIGFTAETMGKPEGKYSYMLQPVNRVLMTAARQGLALDRDYLFCSVVPTARELVNVVAAGFTRIRIGDTAASRDEHGLAALRILMNSGVLGVF